MLAPATLAVVAALAAGAHSPAQAVQRFVLDHSPADACAQLAPAYRKRIEAQYGPCLAGMKVQPKATHLVLRDVHVAGDAATLLASYDVPGSKIRERYTLVRSAGVWLISGAKQLP